MRIQSKAGNENCMDCGAPQPDWADVSFGSLLCIRCAGGHRSLGVGVSSVRSLLYDSFSPEEVIAMALGGNKRLSHALAHTRSAKRSAPRRASLYTTPCALEYSQRLRSQASRAAEDERQPGGLCSPKPTPEPDLIQFPA